ncbi:hypothetical protein F5141DRAFT_1062963 [Pisolithus sp. B1]|nr:hypothetical protein F5141DRAFT_1062963 [Pisolithus sp. B1]
MFVKNSSALQDAVDHILIIFERLIINMGGLEEAAKLQQWRDAEAVRSIVNRTDNVLHMLIGVDKYIHWTENISTPGIPFPNWHQALFPPIESITGHLWLLTVKQRLEWELPSKGLEGNERIEVLRNFIYFSKGLDPCFLQRRSNHYRGWGSQTGGTSLWQLLTATALERSKGHIPTCSTWLAKELVAVSEEKLITQEDNNGDKSKVIEEDIEMDEAIVKPVHG